MKTDLREITFILKPDLASVSITKDEFDKAFSNFSAKVRQGPVTGYCNLTFGKPTHVITEVTQLDPSTYQARVGFLEAHPETGETAKKLLIRSFEDKVKWQFAVTRNEPADLHALPVEIFSIEAVINNES